MVEIFFYILFFLDTNRYTIANAAIANKISNPGTDDEVADVDEFSSCASADADAGIS